MKYMSVTEAAKKWGVTPRSVQIYCEKGSLPGVNLIGKAWQIPANAEKPTREARGKGRSADDRTRRWRAEVKVKMSATLTQRTQSSHKERKGKF